METAFREPGSTGRRLVGRLSVPPVVMTATTGVVVGIALGVLVAAASPLYVVAGLIGLVGLGCVILDVRFALFGFIGVATLVPFVAIPVSLGPIKPTLVDFCLLAVLLTWVFRLLGNRAERLRSSGIDAQVLLFIGVCFTSFVLGTAYQTTTSDVRLFGELIDAIVFFFGVVNCVRDLRTARRLLFAFVWGGTAAGAIAIVLYYLPAATSTRLLGSLSRLGYPSTGILQYIASTTTQRAIGTSIDPNILGATLMMSGVVAVGLLATPRSRRTKALVLGALAPILVALLLTYSRGSLIGFLAGCAVIATLRYRRIWLIGALIVAAILLSSQIDQSSVLQHLQSGIEVQDQAAAMRLGEYKDAFRLISEYPWFGVGFGEAPNVDLYVGVSSIYLLIAEQVGLIGLAIWIWTIVSISVQGLRRCIGARDEASNLAVSCLAALASALVAGLFDHHFVDMHFPHVVATVWLIVGLLAVTTRLLPAGEREPIESRSGRASPSAPLHFSRNGEG